MTDTGTATIPYHVHFCPISIGTANVPYRVHFDTISTTGTAMHPYRVRFDTIGKSYAPLPDPIMS